MTLKQTIKSFVVFLAFAAQYSTAMAQATAFNYNGRLSSNGGPASGTYNFTFTLFNSLSNGVAMANPVTNGATAVSNGLFSVALDFGSGVFTGPEYWLEVAVQTNGAAAFQVLAPRQPLLSTPYALMAGSASNLLGSLPAARIQGALPNANLPTNPAFAGTISADAYIGNGSGLTGLPAGQLTGTIPAAALPDAVLTNGSANVGFCSLLFLTNLIPAFGNNNLGNGIFGVQDQYYGDNPVYTMTLFGGDTFWSSDAENYSDYLQPEFDSTMAAGGPIGNMGLSQYIWNTHLLSLGGADDRSCVGVVTTFGTNAEYGNVIEFLPRKSLHATINSGLFAHPLRLDGYGRVMVGNIPESQHTRFYIGNAYLDLWTGGNSDVPAMLFESDAFASSAITGAFERNYGLPYWTDANRIRSPFLLASHPGNGSGLTNLSPANLASGTISASLLATNALNQFSGSFIGNGGGLTNLSADALTNGLTTSVIVSTPTGQATLWFTNGILRAVNNAAH